MKKIDMKVMLLCNEQFTVQKIIMLAEKINEVKEILDKVEKKLKKLESFSN